MIAADIAIVSLLTRLRAPPRALPRAKRLIETTKPSGLNTQTPKAQKRGVDSSLLYATTSGVPEPTQF
jgi:hypothetical protein